MQTNLRPSHGDRFISQRGFNEDVVAKFGTKVEIFSMDPDEEESEERRNSTLVN